MKQAKRTNPEPKAGQTWRSKDGGALFKIVSLTEWRAMGTSPYGNRPRGVLLTALASPAKWEPVEDVPMVREAAEHLRDEFDTIPADSVKRRLHSLLTEALAFVRQQGHNSALEWAAEQCELGAQRQHAVGTLHGVVICTNLAALVRSGKKTP
jgi:hypothetical protein